MRSRWRLSSTAAVMVTGLMALTGATPALAQPKPAKPAAPHGKAPGKLPPKPHGKLPPKPHGKLPARPMTEKQKKDAARKSYKEAEAKYKAGDYKAALEHFKEADDLLPIPATKYKIAVCRDKLGEIRQAAAGYQLFLDSSPSPDKMADAIADAKSRLDALKKTPGKIRIGIEPVGVQRVTIQVDASPPQPVAALPQERVTPEPPPVPAGSSMTPPPPPPSYEASMLMVSPGHHKITVAADGYDPASTDLDVSFASTNDVQLQLHQAAPPPPPQEPVAQQGPPPPLPPPPPPRSNVPAYVTLGLAGAGLVVGGVFGGLALKAKGDFNNAKVPTTAMADKVDRDALVSDMSFAVALTFGVTGAVLLLSNDSASGEPKTGLHEPQEEERGAWLRDALLQPPGRRRRGSVHLLRGEARNEPEAQLPHRPGPGGRGAHGERDGLRAHRVRRSQQESRARAAPAAAPAARPRRRAARAARAPAGAARAARPARAAPAGPRARAAPAGPRARAAAAAPPCARRRARRRARWTATVRRQRPTACTRSATRTAARPRTTTTARRRPRRWRATARSSCATATAGRRRRPTRPTSRPTRTTAERATAPRARPCRTRS